MQEDSIKSISQILIQFEISNMECVYSSEQEPCEYCSSKNITCIKVWASSSGETRRNVHKYEEPFLSLPLSIVMDAELPDRELLYLQHLYMRKSIPDLDGLGMILPNLWNAYGFVFADKTLLYSVMADYVLTAPDSIVSSNRLVDYVHFKSRFQGSLVAVINRKEVSECHLFAVLFAIFTCINEPTRNYSELRSHQRGFLRILKILISQQSRNDLPDASPLRHLYPYVLSYVRRMSSNWKAEDTMPCLDYEMHVLAHSITTLSSASDLQVTCGIPLQFWNSDGRPSWQGLTYSVYDDIRSLYGCFRTVFSTNKEQPISDLTTSQVIYTIHHIQRKIKVMQNLESVFKVFHMVTSP